MDFMETKERTTRTFSATAEGEHTEGEGTVEQGQPVEGTTEEPATEPAVEENTSTEEVAEEPSEVPEEMPGEEPGDGVQDTEDDLGSPSFLRLTDVDGTEFAGQWMPTMPTVNYIGKTAMLLAYIQQQEKHHHLTMPIRACGIDPILFDNVESAMPDAPTTIFAIAPEGAGEGDTEMYELVLVDGEFYLSCISSCIDKDYLNGIIAEATVSIRETGQYIFQMVGFRKLALEENQQTARLINTLRMNTYEMSALVSYMGKFQGMKVSYETINNHQCICFRV